MAKIKIRVVPVSGDESSLEIEATHSAVGGALTAANADYKKMNLSVNGSPATLDTPIKDGDAITLTEKASGS